jgi:hypothetical protein
VARGKERHAISSQGSRVTLKEGANGKSKGFTGNTEKKITWKGMGFPRLRSRERELINTLKYKHRVARY